MYSPSTPIERICTPPMKVTGSTVEAQPGTAEGLVSATTSTQMLTPSANSEVSNPSIDMTRSGTAEKDVMPSIASPDMRDSEYLVEPAVASRRSYSTWLGRRPNSRTI